jgi:Zn-dependent protease with chaperone function
MADTHARKPEDRGGFSLYLARRYQAVALVLLVLLATSVAAHGQTLTVRDPRDLLAGDPAGFIERLEAARPAPVSMEDMGAILRALPPEGEVTKLGAPAQRKVDAVRQLLKSTGRGGHEIKVIDLPQAAVALHARAVVLISEPAIEVLTADELRAIAAHEIGHEYVWKEWNRAHRDADHERLRELELVCDAIAAVTLHQLGMDPSSVIDALETVARFNRQRFGSAVNEKNYPTAAERRSFAREIQQWLRDSSRRSYSARNAVSGSTSAARRAGR